MNNFSELSLCPALQSNLTKYGFVQPTPVQAEAVPPALAGRDIVATAKTGTGKTLAFLLPLAELLASKGEANQTRIQALILTPTRELALQIQEVAAKLTQGLQAHGKAIRSAVVVGGMNENAQLKNIKQGAQIVIATPGRLCDFLDRKLVNLSSVKFLVLDEADRMLDMGFLPALRLILKAMPATRQTLFFSATIEKSVAHLIESHVKNPVRIAIGSATRPTEQVDLHLYEVEQDLKLSLLHKLLKEDPSGSFLVFARTKHGTDRLAKKLSREGVDTARIHGDRTQSQRNQALHGFKKGDYRVLVATDVAARGIHVDDIAHVVNYDLPQVPEDFVHRVGRTGRAGARGTASTFHTRAERSDIRKIEKALGVRLTARETGRDLTREVKNSEQDSAPRSFEKRTPEKRASFEHKSPERKSAEHKAGGHKSTPEHKSGKTPVLPFKSRRHSGGSFQPRRHRFGSR
jgi:ATP-dependent RNA helicase RhlE